MSAPAWAQWRSALVACLGTEPQRLPRDPLSTPRLAVAPLVRALQQRDVRWVLGGSAVLLTAGGHVVPGDLDEFPQPAPD